MGSWFGQESFNSASSISKIGYEATECVLCDCMCVAVELLGLLLVSVLWGCTNPLLKRGTEGIENIQHNNNNNRVSQILAEVKFLFLNLKVNPEIPSLFAQCVHV